MADPIDSPDQNVSTEHQAGAHSPRDRLDSDRETEGGLEPADVEDRSNVSTVKPEDYPKDRPDA
ncbi:hypothetical protein IAG41_00355 [Sphingomonas sp. JC676]|uniref:hypothetical protein n=1 Tax=Sphingomonas sp. JC676 TaxID=2768065 RepID=UPI0016585A49|nr:hypothetical protein [Sphingomonas sp. JC676]MBC9030832.1 hypothetical protein [Sphingomonas sp. JC676]